MKEEFEAIGMPWDHRGERADEFLEVFEALWSQEEVTHEGPYLRFGPVGFTPKPTNGRIPVWVGGHTTAAFRRTARHGDAFHAAFATPERLADEWGAVRAACEQEGRDPAEVELTMLVTAKFDGASDKPGVLHGSSEQVIDQLAAYKELGVRHTVVFAAARGGLEGRLDAIRGFAEEVIPALA
jgi:alkanesulfonate monooxygenase SsuD/methylene tetrahydromethanopterin reductase-like flavin-dependent oxidoreductase (luciferase family)